MGTNVLFIKITFASLYFIGGIFMEKLNIVKKCKSQMNQPIIKNFLKDENNYALFNKALQEPSDTENIEKLDVAFQKYYKSIKILETRRFSSRTKILVLIKTLMINRCRTCIFLQRRT